MSVCDVVNKDRRYYLNTRPIEHNQGRYRRTNRVEVRDEMVYSRCKVYHHVDMKTYR